MKVSILIPVYNAEKYVAEAIESALNQTYKNIEIIIVDDGSIDKSWEIIETYRQKYPSIIKTYKQENKGAAAARNKGFEISTGQYIQYLDADDLLAPDKIEHQIKYFKGDDREDFIVNGHWIKIKEHINEEIDWGPHKSIQQDLDNIDWILANHMSQTSCWLTPRSLIIKAGVWNEELTFNDDGEFFARVILNSSKVYFCINSKIYYRIHEGLSISKQARTKKGMQSYFNTIVSLENNLLNFENSFRTRKFIANKYLEFLYSYYPQGGELKNIALLKIKNFEKPDFKPKGSKIFEVINDIFGFKVANWTRFLLNYKKWVVK